MHDTLTQEELMISQLTLSIYTKYKHCLLRSLIIRTVQHTCSELELRLSYVVIRL